MADAAKEGIKKTEQTQAIDKEVMDATNVEGNIVNNGCFITESVSFGPCDDFQEKIINIGSLPNQARLLNIRIALDNICRGREIALGVILCDHETNKVLGFKGRTFTLPGTACCDVIIDGFCFIIPERTICSPRTVIVKVTAHYTKLDTNPNCPC